MDMQSPRRSPWRRCSSSWVSGPSGSLTARPNVNTRGETVGELRVNGGLEHEKMKERERGDVLWRTAPVRCSTPQRPRWCA